jgi:SAM-dependent methyltransferase
MTPQQLQRYFQRDLSWGWSHQARLVFEFLMQVRLECAGGALLDAGAGHQRYRPFFEHELLYLSQEHPEGINHKSMHTVVYDFVAPLDKRIPLRDNSLDGIISTSVLEHMRYPDRFFVEAHRVLRPGGRLYSHVPFTYPEHETPYDFQRPTRYGLRRWYEDGGFVDVDVRPATSATETVAAFLVSSVMEDVDALPSRWQRSLGHRLLLTALRRVTRVLTRFVDRGPHATTTFTVGWLAVGSKPGTATSRPGGQCLDRAQFLADWGLREHQLEPL